LFLFSGGVHCGHLRSAFVLAATEGVPKLPALALILVAILIAGLLFGALIVPSLNDFLIALPDYQDRLSAQIAALLSWLREMALTFQQKRFPVLYIQGG